MSERQPNGNAPAHDEFPVDNYRDAARHLRRPFTPAAVKFRLLEVRETKRGARGTVAAYIDMRLAAERLNLVCPHLWSDSYEPVQGGLRCELRLDGLLRSDVGWSRGTATDMDLKALYSDAFKRAAVKFGVGVSLYAVPGLVAWESEGHLRTWKKGDKLQGVLTPQGEQAMRERYSRWLTTHGVAAFGDPLDHGDVEDTQSPAEAPPGVDPATGEVVPAEGPQTPPAATLDDARATTLERMAKTLVDGKVWTGRALKAQLVAAGARDTSSVGVAVRSLSAEQADALEKAMEQAVGAETAA